MNYFFKKIIMNYKLTLLTKIFYKVESEKYIIEFE